MFYHSLVVTFHEKEGHRHEEMPKKKQVGLYL